MQRDDTTYKQPWEVFWGQRYAVVIMLGQACDEYADYVLVTPDLVAHKPAAVSHVHAAGVPVAGLAA